MIKNNISLNQEMNMKYILDRKNVRAFIFRIKRSMRTNHKKKIIILYYLMSIKVNKQMNKKST